MYGWTVGCCSRLKLNCQTSINVKLSNIPKIQCKQNKNKFSSFIMTLILKARRKNNDQINYILHILQLCKVGTSGLELGRAGQLLQEENLASAASNPTQTQLTQSIQPNDYFHLFLNTNFFKSLTLKCL